MLIGIVKFWPWFFVHVAVDWLTRLKIFKVVKWPLIRIRFILYFMMMVSWSHFLHWKRAYFTFWSLWVIVHLLLLLLIFNVMVSFSEWESHRKRNSTFVLSNLFLELISHFSSWIHKRWLYFAAYVIILTFYRLSTLNLIFLLHAVETIQINVLFISFESLLSLKFALKLRFICGRVCWFGSHRSWNKIII